MAARNAFVSQQAGPAVGALFTYGVDDPSVLLTDNGWRVTSVKQPGDEDASFGRWVQPQGVGAGFFFVMAERPFLPTRTGPHGVTSWRVLPAAEATDRRTTWLAHPGHRLCPTSCPRPVRRCAACW
jgi:hypothetical protein